MDTIECIKTRRSIRQFKPEPVPREVLMDVIHTAKWSPSYKNSQPWELIILSGAKKQKLTEIMIDLVEKDEKPVPDLAEPTSWPAAEAARIKNHLKRRAALMGGNLNDPDALKKAKIINFGFYGAPHAIYLFQEASLSLWSLFDMGLFAQSLMLAANAKGLGTVPQAFPIDYSKAVKEFLSIPETKRLVLGISIGYPDMESPVNQFRSDRAETDDMVKWIE
ncbi:MAG: nitroreductase [Pseudomonadota bacterium]